MQVHSSDVATPQSVTLTGTGTFTGGTYSALPGLTLNNTTGAIIPGTSTPGTYTVTYTIAASGGCPGATATTSVTIVAVITLDTQSCLQFICSGCYINCTANTTIEWITGTWSPALNNTATTTYTFTPTAGQCATTTTLTIVVNPNITPTFNAVAPICSGNALLHCRQHHQWHYRYMVTGIE